MAKQNIIHRPRPSKRYRRKAMECHPDRVTFTGMTKEQADEAFKILSAAYIVLAREYGK